MAEKTSGSVGCGVSTCRMEDVRLGKPGSTRLAWLVR